MAQTREEEREEEKVGTKELAELLSRFHFLISYIPLRTEVPFRELVPALGAHSYEIAPRAALDPTVEATNAIAAAGTERTAVLIPGRRYDASGTRHGQGGGWYDRFLALVPAEWVRIGFCFDDQFSTTALPRQPWDQVMDYMCVVDRKSGNVELYETRARTSMLSS